MNTFPKTATADIKQRIVSVPPAGADCNQHWALPGLAQRINATTAAAEADARNAMTKALEAGRLLIEAKQMVEHGEWETWLQVNCQIASRTAQAYMRLARTIPQLEHQEAQRVADLPLREAVRAIGTKPEAPPRCAGVRVERRDDAQRVAATFKAGAKAMREAARRIELIHELKGQQVAALRKKLSDAMAALDQIGGAA